MDRHVEANTRRLMGKDEQQDGEQDRDGNGGSAEGVDGFHAHAFSKSTAAIAPVTPRGNGAKNSSTIPSLPLML